MLLRTLTKANLVYILAKLGCCWLLVSSFVGCARPAEYLQVGDTIIYANTIDNAAENLKLSFPEFGDSTLRAHLLMNGLAEAEILHQEKAVTSPQALQKMDALRSSLQGYKPEDLSDSDLSGFQRERKRCAPNPSRLGAGIAAITATLENGQWSQPAKTSAGWAIVYLHDRRTGPRSVAEVDVEIIQIIIGTQADFDANRLLWANSPLEGSNRLISCLPYEFRNRNNRD